MGHACRAALQRRLQDAKGLVRRIEENIVFQRQMIATLDGGGHDVKAARMFLRRLEAKQAKYVADRDRLFKELANH
jgi:formyltetrahydrofolate hydrolase